ncbi:MAG TPA: DUF3754 domain-containing protein [Gemmataceae bacterium]|nr:DUF3754 domain-containing protein [Gemmataceae bacterium]
MAQYKDREHFIPIRSRELVELLGGDKDLKPQDRELFRQFCRLVSATLHFEYKSRLDELKDAYAPFDPDPDTRSVVRLGADERQRRLNELFCDFAWLMERANFKHLSRGELEPALHGCSDWGIDMDVDFGAFERIAIFARGDAWEKRTRRRLRGMYRLEEAMVPVYKRLVIILKMRKHKRLPREVDTQSVYLKVFKDIPKLDVKMLLPGAQVCLSRFDRGRIGVPLVTGAGMMVWRVVGLAWKAIMDVGDDVVHAVMGAATGNPWLVWWIVASGSLGYGYQSYYGYRQLRQRYHLTLTESLYYQNLDSNGGVLTRVLDEAEEQQAGGAMLAYYFLWRYAGEQGWTGPALDDYVETYLEGATGLKVDFGAGAALATLERMRVVRKCGDLYRAVPVEKALEMLDWTWDNYFKYNNPEPEAPPVA